MVESGRSLLPPQSLRLDLVEIVQSRQIATGGASKVWVNLGKIKAAVLCRRPDFLQQASRHRVANFGRAILKKLVDKRGQLLFARIRHRLSLRPDCDADGAKRLRNLFWLAPAKRHAIVEPPLGLW